MSLFLSRFLPNDDRTAQRWLLASGVLCLLIFWASLPLPRVDGHLVGSDGIRYYSILRSVILDGDFSFANDYALFGARIVDVPETGLTANPFAIGSAILWLPFFLLAHLIALLLNGIGLSVSTNGATYLYEAITLTGTILYASLGYLLIYRTARRLVSVQVALLATLAMWWTTQSIYYIIAEPSMSHANTVFSGALFLWLWYPASPERTTQDWVKLGLATALLALVRWQEGVLVLVPLIELLWWVHKKKLPLQKAIRHGAIFMIVVLIGFLPQFIMWNVVYGSPLTLPQGSGFMEWLAPNPLLALFSTRHGLISWHPVYLFALLGLGYLWRKDKALTLVVLFAFLSQLYINSAAERWWADDAFGGRRFTGLIPF